MIVHIVCMLVTCLSGLCNYFVEGVTGCDRDVCACTALEISTYSNEKH